MTFDYYDPTDPDDRRRVFILAPLALLVLVPFLLGFLSQPRVAVVPVLALAGLIFYCLHALWRCLRGRGTPDIFGH